jgi:orotate phosphoribosyltransferase
MIHAWICDKNVACKKGSGFLGFYSCIIRTQNQQIGSRKTMKTRLLQLIYDKTFRYSAEPVFKLVSGRMSNYYFNCKAVTLHPAGMYLIGNSIYDMIKASEVRGVGGLTLGADPIACAVAYTSYLKGDAIEAFVVRKTAKSHGTMQWIEGNVAAGDRVVIVDDVITTGKSTIEAITRAREGGLDIAKVIALVDRQEGGRENIETLGCPVEAVITREEVMELYRAKNP